ncbi:MAG TPA: hypothetical protein VMG10_26660 [Gemmataceae bacterium]|nr:hypothetical protein [Gemmataceae bacterium]
MNVIYSDPLLQQPTACLEEIIAPSIFADQVQAEWDRGQDLKGHTLFTLRLSAWGESAAASFTPRDLRDLREVRWRLRNLWDDLLRLSIERSLKNLLKGSDDA